MAAWAPDFGKTTSEKNGPKVKKKLLQFDLIFYRERVLRFLTLFFAFKRSRII